MLNKIESKGRSAKLSFKPRSFLSLVSSSCSCKIMFFPPTDAELYGSLTQSRHSVEAEEKWISMNFHHNSKKKNRKNHIADFSDFHFSVMVKIHRKLTILSTKIIISQKLKIWNMIFPIFLFQLVKIHRNSLLFSLHRMPWLGYSVVARRPNPEKISIKLQDIYTF